MALGAGAASRTSDAAASEATGFVARINAARAEQGLPPLARYWDLDDDAERHARRMAGKNRIFGVPDLGTVTTGWAALGAYEGAAPTTGTVYQTMMSSDGHRRHVLGDYDRVGVGVARGPGDLRFVSLVFMRSADSR